MEPINYARVADLYDSHVQVTFDIPFFLNETKKTSGEVLELMSGTGRVSLTLIEAGVRLTCVDASVEMLVILREKLTQRGLSADVYQMDVRELALDKKFDLIFIPFHSFMELTTLSDQRQTLAAIRKHLADGGRFICTLGNPVLRLKTVDGKLGLIGKFPLAEQATLFLWSIANYNPATRIVEGTQFYEEYDARGIMRAKRMMDIRFATPSKCEFQELAESAGFKLVALYGDYEYGEFQEETSRFMIWVLEGRGD